ncbi:MAG: DUF4900 domain-containing protein [Verrucomicrobia bacterium]|nr:DUF4900 domain-containing protein [Verrucomicrobiota bacterium]MBU4247798.1 DUF4900 domain-containing protein [Verrucomicrobiota bacterium]MBU4292086.1 DUF4900 domain-containing protein [Verrucomicrobiota bacterium]
MNTNNNSGVVLVAVVAFTAIAAILALGLLSESSFQLKLANRQECLEQAFYVAEGGAERAVSCIRNSAGAPPNSITGSIGNGAYSVAINSVAGGGGQTWYTIASTGEVNGFKKSVIMTGVRQDTWARYAVWYDHNPGGNYFMGPSVFNGPVHANDRINLWGNPTFNALVTSAAATWGNWSAAAIFNLGFQLGVPVQTLNVNFTNTGSPNSCLQTLAGLVVTGATSINLQNTNVFISNAQRGWTNVNYVTNHPDFLGTGMIYIASSGANTGTVQIGGANFNGRLTVVADQDIRITNHITYAVHPTNNSDDAIGLIARRDVVVMTNAPNDLNIYAHIIACNPTSSWYAGFYVQNFLTRPDSGLLTVYGGIVENNFGVEGCYWGGSTFTGFSEDNWVFDARFATDPPPFYPNVNNAYTWNNWREVIVP